MKIQFDVKISSQGEILLDDQFKAHDAMAALKMAMDTINIQDKPKISISVSESK